MMSYSKRSSLLVISIFLLGIIISLTPIQSTLTLVEGSRFDYAVVCTDYCGSKIWDATYLDADLFVILLKLNSQNDLVSFYTAYNSTTLINRSYTSDYGFFSMNETFSLSTGENLNQTGIYSWQRSNLQSVMNVSIPYFFLAHAPSSFQNNTHTVRKGTDAFELSITPTQSFYGHKYHGTWIYTYSTANSTITVVSELILFYDSISGLLLKMEVEMQSTQDFTGPIPQDPNVEAIGSFKMILVLPIDDFITTTTLLFSLSSFVVLVINRRRING